MSFWTALPFRWINFILISPLGLSSGETRSCLIIHFKSKNGLTRLKNFEEVPSMAKESGYPGLKKTKKFLSRRDIPECFTKQLDGLTYGVSKKRADEQLNFEPPMLDV